MPLSKYITLPLLAITMGLSAPLQAEEVLATVNDASITRSDFQRFVLEATGGKGGKVNSNVVLNELLSRELIYQDAIKQEIDKRKDIVAELEYYKFKLIVGTALDEMLKKDPIKESDLQALYDTQVKSLKLKEFKARHILVKEKNQAEKIITELDLGADFAKLAEKHSTDAGSKKNGGDLGWFNPQAMVPQFAKALNELKKGKYSQAPVQSQYGWHIIKHEDNRDAPPPSFEKVKPKLSQLLQQQKMAVYIQKLKSKAKITINQK